MQIQYMFRNVAKVFCNKRTDFLLIIRWFLGGLSDIWLVCEWFDWFLGVLWMVWLVCGWFVAGLWVAWLVGGWFDWCVAGLAGLWVVSSFTANGRLM